MIFLGSLRINTIVELGVQYVVKVYDVFDFCRTVCYTIKVSSLIFESGEPAFADFKKIYSNVRIIDLHQVLRERRIKMTKQPLFVVDSIEADAYIFTSKVFSEAECKKIVEDLRRMKNHRDKLTYLLNTYAERGLDFVNAQPLVERSMASMFMGPGLWMGTLFFHRIKD